MQYFKKFTQITCFWALCSFLSFHRCTFPKNLPKDSAWQEVADSIVPPSHKNVHTNTPCDGIQRFGSSSTAGSLPLISAQKRPLESSPDTRFSFEEEGYVSFKRPRMGGSYELDNNISNEEPLSIDRDFLPSPTPNLMGHSDLPQQSEISLSSQGSFSDTSALESRPNFSTGSKSTQMYSSDSSGPSVVEKAVAEILLTLSQARFGNSIQRERNESENFTLVPKLYLSPKALADWKTADLAGRKITSARIDYKKLQYPDDDLVVNNFLSSAGLSFTKKGNLKECDQELLYALITTLTQASRAIEVRRTRVSHSLNPQIGSSLKKYGGNEQIVQDRITTLLDLRNHMLLLNSWTLKIMTSQSNALRVQAEEQALESAFDHLFAFDQVKQAVLNPDIANSKTQGELLKLLQKLILSPKQGRNDSPLFSFGGRSEIAHISEREILKTMISLNFIKSYYQTINSSKWKAAFYADEGYLCLMVALADKLRSNIQFRCRDSFKKLQSFLPWEEKLTPRSAQAFAKANKPWLQFKTYMTLERLECFLIKKPNPNMLSATPKIFRHGFNLNFDVGRLDPKICELFLASIASQVSTIGNSIILHKEARGLDMLSLPHAQPLAKNSQLSATTSAQNVVEQKAKAWMEALWNANRAFLTMLGYPSQDLAHQTAQKEFHLWAKEKISLDWKDGEADSTSFKNAYFDETKHPQHNGETNETGKVEIILGMIATYYKDLNSGKWNAFYKTDTEFLDSIFTFTGCLEHDAYQIMRHLQNLLSHCFPILPWEASLKLHTFQATPKFFMKHYSRRPQPHKK
ncbi:hypothetical protein O181_003166, partial [Austropuccinia psidii MF-1]|nr:hypothetical protein [Austropuccinia psidii MF-1]